MNSKDIAISVENISKVYRLGVKDAIHETFAATFTDYLKNPLKNYKKHRSLYKFDDVFDEHGVPLNVDREDVLWALKDVSFDVINGDVLGVIGGNGAGKSTLLKILSRVTHPSSGKLHIHGRVGSLLEVGTGFHPDLTGRDNIYLNGTILGMRRAEVERKLDQIVDFSGVEKFIDTPVKRYSSGMTVRLAFAVAAHLEPEILIIDEVLAVGDAEFQKKCLNKMEDVGKGGRTVIFVSHNMAAVSALCTRGIVIQKGQITYMGNTSEAVDIYLGSGKVLSSDLASRDDREGNGDVKMMDLWLENNKGQRVTDIRLGETITIKGSYKGAQPGSKLRIVFEIGGHLRGRMMRFDTSIQGNKGYSWPQDGVVSCQLDAPINLDPGSYHILYAIYNSENELEDYLPKAMMFHVLEDDFFGSGRLYGIDNCRPMFLMKHNWTVESGN